MKHAERFSSNSSIKILELRSSNAVFGLILTNPKGRFHVLRMPYTSWPKSSYAKSKHAFGNFVASSTHITNFLSPSNKRFRSRPSKCRPHGSSIAFVNLRKVFPTSIAYCGKQRKSSNSLERNPKGRETTSSTHIKN